jgi:hypothetical protein
MVCNLELKVNKRGMWEKFLGAYTAKQTVKSYKRLLKQFMAYIYGEEWQPLLENVEKQERSRLILKLAIEYADRYFNEERDYEKDLIGFFKSKLSIAPKSYMAMVSVVKNFLMENDVELRERFWKKIKKVKKGSRAISVYLFGFLFSEVNNCIDIRPSSSQRPGPKTCHRTTPRAVQLPLCLRAQAVSIIVSFLVK